MELQAALPAELASCPVDGPGWLTLSVERWLAVPSGDDPSCRAAAADCSGAELFAGPSSPVAAAAAAAALPSASDAEVVSPA